MTLIGYDLRRTRTAGIFASTALFCFHFLMAYVYRALTNSLAGGPAVFTRFIPKQIQAFLGVDRLAPDSIEGFLALVYQHPFVLIVVAGLVISCCSELLAGRLERLTIVHLLSRPLCRAWLPLSAQLVTLCWLCGASLAAVFGTGAGFSHLGLKLPHVVQLAKLAAMLFLLGSALAGMSLIFSAALSLRADAIGWTVTLLLIMYIGNFLSQLWLAAKPWAQLSLFNYYVPIHIFLEGSIPLPSVVIFILCALGGTLVSCAIYLVREFHV